MFPAIMLWPMTLTHTNEAIRRENHAKKLDTEKITVMIWEVIEDVRIVLVSNKCKILVRVGERVIELMVLPYFVLIYRISSVNGCTLRILSCSILIPR